MIEHVNSLEELQAATKEGKVLVDFFATWCGPCRMLGPELEKLAEAEPEITVLKVDCDDFGEIAGAFGVSSIPAMFLLKDGKVVANKIGFARLPELKEFVAQAK